VEEEEVAVSVWQTINGSEGEGGETEEGGEEAEPFLH